MSEQPERTRVGLIGRDDEHAPVPLTGVTIDAVVCGFCARVVITQRYVNRETTPIEAVYVFPLEEGAAVCGFEAVIDGTLVVGEVKEREEAFERYDDAIAGGHGAFLLDEERPDVFQASIGNLLPGKEVLLKITYVTELTTNATGLRFAIPTTVSPRYAPAADRIGVGRTDAEGLNPNVAWKVPYGLNLSVRIAMPDRIARVESPSHPISVALDGTAATISLSQSEAPLDRDFVLSVETTSFDNPASWIERDEDGSLAAAVAFVPKFEGGRAPAEVVFVVDRSGSMQGTSIDEVRNALQLCLRSMSSGCRFNIVGFGSTYETLFKESRVYNDSNLAEATRYVANLDANLGGTEILDALKFVLEQRVYEGLARQVVVLTDGQVTNTDAVLALAAKHSATSRIFTFGIGRGTSHHLVVGLARAGGGVAEFIYPGERIESKVLRQFGRLLSPGLTDVRVEWHGIDATQAPVKVPPVFDGGRLLVYGLLRSSHAGTVTLRATSPSGSLAFEIPLDPVSSIQGRTVATLAARARIRELEESPDWISARGSRQRDRAPNRIKQEIITLATTYGLASRETSFVAVERRDNPVLGDMQLRRVPIALTNGWGGMDEPIPLLGALAYGERVGDTGDAGLLMGRMSGDWPQRARRPVERGSGPTLWSRLIARATPADFKLTALHRLVSLQRADGSWDLDRRFADVIGRTLSDIEFAVPEAQGRDKDVRRAWATALALAWLRKHAADFEDEWRMLAEKGEKWLGGAAATLPAQWTWIDRADAFLSDRKM